MECVGRNKIPRFMIKARELDGSTDPCLGFPKDTQKGWSEMRRGVGIGDLFEQEQEGGEGEAGIGMPWAKLIGQSRRA